MKKKDEKSSPLKAGIWYTISNFFVKGLIFLTMPIFTRIMSSNDVGQFSNISSWLNILTIIVTFQLYSSINAAKFKYKEDLNAYMSSILFLGSVITICFYIVVLFFRDFFVGFFCMDFLSINVIFIYLIFYPAIEIFQVKNRIDYNYKSTVFLSIGSFLLATLCGIFMVLISENKLIGRVLGYYIPLIVISIFVYIIIMFKGKSISKKYWKFSLVISFPLIWHLLAGTLLNSSDKIMITNIIGEDANAKYSVAYTCSMVISVLWNSMNAAWSPWAFEMMEKNDSQSLKKNVIPYFSFFCFVAVAFMLFAPDLLYIMGGKNYISAINVLPPVMLGYIFQFVYSLYINIEYYYRKQKYMAIGTIIAACINIFLNYIFIPRFGYVGAAYTTLIGYIVLFLIHYVIVKKMNYSYFYDIKFFLKGLTIMSVVTILLKNVYQYTVVRYMLIIAAFIAFIFMTMKNKKVISGFIKRAN